MRGAKVLIIEGEAMIAMALERIVEAAGGRPVILNTFVQASILSGHWPDIALAIVNPPDTPAHERIARDMQQAGITLVVSSAVSGFDPAAHGLAGALPLLKPFTETDVEILLAVALGRAKA